MVAALRDREGSWLFAIPIRNLVLTDVINYEFKVSRVTFLASHRLAGRRIRLGFPARISEMNAGSKGILDRALSEAGTIALVRQRGVLSHVEADVLRLVREEIAILVTSQLGIVDRLHNAAPAISNEDPSGVRRYAVVNVDSPAWLVAGGVVGKTSSLHLDGEWKRLQHGHFFKQLLRAIRGDLPLARKWRRDLRNAAVMVGQSLASLDLPQAFLWNVIALELLLTGKDDKSVMSTLPSRAEAFLGWASEWKTTDYEARIRAAYEKRSRLVHQGARDEITMDDLEFTDHLLTNLFLNLLSHVKLFRSKEAVIEFSRKVEAEHVLGIDTRVRPRTLQFGRLMPRPGDPRRRDLR